MDVVVVSEEHSTAFVVYAPRRPAPHLDRVTLVRGAELGGPTVEVRPARRCLLVSRTPGGPLEGVA
jgi:hypothetical protein